MCQYGNESSDSQSPCSRSESSDTNHPDPVLTITGSESSGHRDLPRVPPDRLSVLPEVTAPPPPGCSPPVEVSAAHDTGVSTSGDEQRQIGVCPTECEAAAAAEEMLRGVEALHLVPSSPPPLNSRVTVCLTRSDGRVRVLRKTRRGWVPCRSLDAAKKAAYDLQWEERAGITPQFAAPTFRVAKDNLLRWGATGLPLETEGNWWPLMQTIDRIREEFFDRVVRLLSTVLRENPAEKHESPLEVARWVVSKVNEKLPKGITCYVSNHACQRQRPPYTLNTPRFYVEVSRFARMRGGGRLPPPPAELTEILGYRPVLRNSGFLLVPPGGEPQQTHFDVHCAKGQFHHIAWKRQGAITTEMLPDTYFEGNPYMVDDDIDFDCFRKVGQKVALFDSTLRHRGGYGELGRWSGMSSIELLSTESLLEWPYDHFHFRGGG
eukprot:Hpha_TRINITY_DN14755_c0_g2::TRINITY_DN14755_c0_g2_i1::g.102816::m.102816